MRRVGAVLVAAALAGSAPRAQTNPGPQDRAQFRADTDTVALYATVTGRDGAIITDLGKNDFEVLDNGVRRDVTVFAAGGQPITGVLLLDMNGSFRDIPWLQAAGEQFLASLQPQDRVRIGTFGDEIMITPLLTGDRRYLTWVLREELWPARRSPLWMALDTAMSSLALETGRRDIIVLTNGQDLGVELDYVMKPWSTVPTRAQREGFVIHTVGFTALPLDRRLRSLARDTGGHQFVVKDLSGAGDAFTDITRSLQSQYLVGFVPAVLDGKPHEIAVRVKRPGAVVHTRTRYIAAVTR